MILHDITTTIVIIVTMAFSVTTRAALIEDFDGGGSTPYTLTQSGGGPGPFIAAGGPSGNYIRLTSLTSSNMNSIAFDKDVSQTGATPNGLILQFDYRMTDNATNSAAGGCCGSAADGMRIGLFDASVY